MHARSWLENAEMRNTTVLLESFPNPACAFNLMLLAIKYL